LYLFGGGGVKEKGESVVQLCKGRFEAITKVVDERPVLDIATFQSLIEDVDDDKDELDAKVQLIALLREYKLVNDEDKIVI
jgi:hypothetical protein